VNLLTTERQHIIIVTFSAAICVKTMQTLEQTLSESCDWAIRRVESLTEEEKHDDAFCIVQEFCEWLPEDEQEHDIYSLEWLGEDSD